MPLEEHGRLVEHGVEPVPAPRASSAWGDDSSYSSVTWNRSASHSIAPTKSTPSVFLDEADDVTALAAAKAVVELVDRIDRKARGALVVERTAADEAAALLA